MNNCARFILIPLLFVCFGERAKASIDLKICDPNSYVRLHDFRVNDVARPLNLEKNGPIVFGWLVEADRFTPQGYRIIIASSREKLLHGGELIWDSGLVPSVAAANVEYRGAKLAPAQAYFWSVGVFNSKNQIECYSAPQMFATGLWDEWQDSEFIQAQDKVGKWSKHSWLKKAIPLRAQAIESANAYVLAEDRFKFWVNGKFVGSGPTRAFEPVGKSWLASLLAQINSVLLGDSAIRSKLKLNSVAYDFLPMLKSGEDNLLSFHAKGALRVHLKIRYVDGSQFEVVSDKSWLARDVTPAFVRDVPGYGKGLISPISVDPAGRQILDEYENIDGEFADVVTLLTSKSDDIWLPARERRQFLFFGRTREVSTAPTESVLIAPKKVSKSPSGHVLLDFGATWIAGLSLNGLRSPDSKEVVIRYGTYLTPRGDLPAKLQEFHGSEIEFRESWRLKVGENWNEHFSWRAFRWVEIAGLPEGIDPSQIRIRTYHYPMNASNAAFQSSEPDLNRFWEVVRHTQKALTLDLYMDTPNRERMPYEADAYINSQCHAMLDREFALMRMMVRFFVDNPTWPTEWRFYPIAMAWENYWRDGNLHELKDLYSDLKGMTQTQFAKPEWDGLIDPPTEPVIDWPKSERGGFELREINIVENSFYFWGLSLMSKIAKAVGKGADAQTFADQAVKVESAINKHFWDGGQARYRDGAGGASAAWVSTYLPIALGVTPPGGYHSVKKSFESLPEDEFPSSPYGAYWVLKALFRLQMGEKATRLMLARGTRTWYNMIVRNDATTTFEAWGPELKENMSRNHPWSCGIVPALYRDVVGLRALEPGFKSFEIRPQLGVIGQVSIKIVTQAGPIEVQLNAKDIYSHASIMKVRVPSNSKARLCLPVRKNQHLVLNGISLRNADESFGYKCLDTSGGYQVLSVGS